MAETKIVADVDRREGHALSRREIVGEPGAEIDEVVAHHAIVLQPTLVVTGRRKVVGEVEAVTIFDDCEYARGELRRELVADLTVDTPMIDIGAERQLAAIFEELKAVRSLLENKPTPMKEAANEDRAVEVPEFSIDFDEFISDQNDKSS